MRHRIPPTVPLRDRLRLRLALAALAVWRRRRPITLYASAALMIGAGLVGAGWVFTHADQLSTSVTIALAVGSAALAGAGGQAIRDAHHPDHADLPELWRGECPECVIAAARNLLMSAGRLAPFDPDREEDPELLQSAIMRLVVEHYWASAAAGVGGAEAAREMAEAEYRGQEAAEDERELAYGDALADREAKA